MDENEIEINVGDVVFATAEIRNDGSHPELPEEALIAPEGTRGVVVNVGHLEEQPEQVLVLVQFEQANGELGPPTGCWPDELRGVEK
ncbi:nitrogen fixation protein NifZ [Endothiovibrio diazotrophicus]